MIRAMLLAVLPLLAAPVEAQEPDALDWHRYYPLAVGNVWEYHDAEGPDDLMRHVLEDDTVAGGRSYYRRRTLREFRTTTDTLRFETLDFVRYDAAGFVIAVASPEADTTAADPCALDLFSRPLRLGFGARIACPGAGAGGPDSLVVEGAYDVWWAPEVLSGNAESEQFAARKLFTAGGVLFTEFIADVGPVGGGNLWGPRLHYARVGGREYGVPEVSVARELEPPVVAELSVRLLENPVRGRAAIEVRASASRVVRAEVFDAVGRRVWSSVVPITARRGRIEGPTSDLGAGAYFVTVSAEGGEAATRLFVVAR